MSIKSGKTFSSTNKIVQNLFISYKKFATNKSYTESGKKLTKIGNMLHNTHKEAFQIITGNTQTISFK